MENETNETTEKKEYTMLSWVVKEKILELWGTKPVNEILDELGMPRSKKQAIHSLVSRERKNRYIKDGRAFMRAN